MAAFGMAVTLAFPLAAQPAPAISETPKTWEKMMNIGVTALDSNEYWIAEPTLTKAVEKARTFKHGDQRLAKSLAELGRYYRVRGRFSVAEPYLEEEIQIREEATGEDIGKIVPAIGSLVKFYLLYGTRSKAGPKTEMLFAYIDGKIKEHSTAKAAAKMKLQKGAPLVGWAGTAVVEACAPMIEWAITCDDLGNTYKSLGDLAQAERLFKAAFDIKAAVLGKHHLSLAASYDSLGSICMLKKEYSDAESYFKDSVDITERILGRDHHQTFARLDRLARCELEAGKLQDAKNLYLQALEFFKVEPSKSGDEARTLRALGNICVEQKNYSGAASYLWRALRLAEKFHGPSSVELVGYLRNLAYAEYYSGRSGQADNLRARAKALEGIMDPIQPVVHMQAGAWPLKKAKVKPEAEAAASKSKKVTKRPDADLKAGASPIKTSASKPDAKIETAPPFKQVTSKPEPKPLLVTPPVADVVKKPHVRIDAVAPQPAETAQTPSQVIETKKPDAQVSADQPPVTGSPNTHLEAGASPIEPLPEKDVMHTPALLTPHKPEID